MELRPIFLYNQNMQKKIWVRKFRSPSEAENSDLEYYLNLTPEERLSIVQMLREEYYKFRRKRNNASRKRLSRVFKIIKQA